MSDLLNESYFPTLTPYLVVRDAQAAINFYEKAFGAKARNIARTPDNSKIMNAQLVIGDSVLMLNDEFPEYGSTAPQPGDHIPICIHINSKNVNADWQRAVDAGVTVVMPLEDQFWGDRYGRFTCPFGYQWSMGQKMKDLSQEEIEKAAIDAFATKS